MVIDIAIVGAGAAGLYLGTALAESGKRVLILESGPSWQTSDLISSQIWARRLKWRGAPVANIGKHRFGNNMSTGSGLGGAALHHYAGWPRLRESDFKLQQDHGKGLDWPIAYEDLRPWYDLIQDEFGIAGDAGQEQGRPAGNPYPMPPLPTFNQGHVLTRGFTARGLKVSPTPMAINTKPYQGRPACLYDGWCDAGCPTGALANPLLTQVPRARAVGVYIQTGCEVLRIATDNKGRASEVDYLDENHNKRRVQAKLIVLSAATVQNVRILLNSVTKQHPQGIGNNQDLVGRYFMGHTMVNIFGLFEDDMQNHFGTTGGQHMCFEEYPKVRQGGPFGSYIWGFGQALKPNDLLGVALTRPELFGRELDRFIRQGKQHLSLITSECETLAQADNQISLSERKDRHGLPLAQIDNTLSDNSLALWEHARKAGRLIVEAAGAMQVWESDMFLSHPLGGTIMGNNAFDSVVDSFGEVHDCPHLFVAGGSLFPSTGAVGPTHTIYALAARTAAHIDDNWKAFAA